LQLTKQYTICNISAEKNNFLLKTHTTAFDLKCIIHNHCYAKENQDDISYIFLNKNYILKVGILR